MNRRDIIAACLSTVFDAAMPTFAVSAAASPPSDAMSLVIEEELLKALQPFVGQPRTKALVAEMVSAAENVVDRLYGPFELGDDGELYPAKGSPLYVESYDVFYEVAEPGNEAALAPP
jgi:hypothetical protein